jgi:hypothetical protein
MKILCMSTINWTGWGNKWSCPTSKYYSLIGLEGLKKCTNSPSQDSSAKTWTHCNSDALALSQPVLWISFIFSFRYSGCDPCAQNIHHCLPCPQFDTCELLIPLDNILTQSSAVNPSYSSPTAWSAGLKYSFYCICATALKQDSSELFRRNFCNTTVTHY